MFARPTSALAKALVILCLTLAWSIGAAAQAVENPGAENPGVPPTVELDLQRLINSPPGQGASAWRDPVWEVSAGSGRVIVMLPLIVRPGESPYELARPDYTLRRARFIGWYVPGTGGMRNNFERQSGRRFPMNVSQTIADLLQGPDETLDGTNGRGSGASDGGGFEGEFGGEFGDEFGRPPATGAPGTGDVESDTGYDPVAPGAPRLARKLTIHPDASVVWEMDRTFPGAQVRRAGDENLYGYKLDSAAIQAAEPPRMERLERRSDESSREFQTRRREQSQAHREKLNAFRALRTQIRDLPEEFRQPLPEVIYAVFDAPSSGGLALSGPEPLPWVLGDETFAALQALSNSRGESGTNAQYRQRVRQANAVLQDSSQMADRAVALAVYQGGFAGQVTTGDDGYALLVRLLGSADDLTRTITLAAVAQATPPTRASARLLGEAARTVQGDDKTALQLASLGRLFGIDASDADQLVSQTNAALTMDNGPRAGQVIEQLLLAIEHQQASSRNAGDDASFVDVLTGQVDIDQAHPEQMAEVVSVVLQWAPTSSVAAGWLNLGLLQSDNEAVIDRTLEMLSQADIAAPPAETADEPQAPDQAPAENDPPEENIVAPADDVLMLTGRIPMSSADHGLITALQSADPDRRQLAWQALRHFELVSASAVDDGQMQIAFDRIVDTGLEKPDTPAYLVDFIDNQQSGPLARHAEDRMIELLMSDGVNAETAGQAVGLMLGSGHDYGSAIGALNADQRNLLVDRLYELSEIEPPLAAGLIRSDNLRELPGWLGQQLQSGELPDDRDWATAGGNTDELIRLIGGQDPMVAMAASAAMVVNVGGDARQQSDFARQIVSLPQRDQLSIQDAWDPIRSNILTQRLSEAVGSYRLILRVRGQDAQDTPDRRQADPPTPARDNTNGFDEFNEFGGGQPSQPSQPSPRDTRQAPPVTEAPLPVLKTIDLGIIDLRVNDGGIALSVEAVAVSLAEDYLAIRIDSVASLASFNNTALAALPLSQIRESVDLMPRDQGAWRGSITLPDGRVLEIELTPEG